MNTQRGLLRQRRRRLAVIMLCAVAFAAGGVVSPLWIRSPQQLAAEAAPPELTVLTAPVERRVLRDVLVVRGEIRSSNSFKITPGSRSAGQAIVTAVRVDRGDFVSAGTVVVEVGGRPLIVLPGAVPAYRDMKPGTSGKDIEQLQRALAGLGHEPGEHDGHFGSGTKRALGALYESLGYVPVPADEGDERHLANLRRQIVEAERAVADQRDALDALLGDPKATEGQKSSAAKALDRATGDLDTVRGELSTAVAASGPMLPFSEYTFLPEFPARVELTNAALGGAVTTPLLELSTGEPVVQTVLTSAQKALCRPGAKVDIAGSAGVAAAGRVGSVSDERQDSPGGSPQGTGYPATVIPSAALDPRHVGQTVKLTVEVAVSDGEELVVPVTALYAAADSQVYVNKVLPGGRVEQVVVQAGLSAGGYVAVVGRSGALDENDQVTIGQART